MALDFDGTDDKVDHGAVANINGATKNTTSLWFRPGTLELNAGLIRGKMTTTGGYQITERHVTSHVVQWWSNRSGINGGYGSTVLVAGTWYHLVCVYDGTQVAQADRLKMYLDGAAETVTLVGTVPASLGADEGGTTLVTGQSADSVYFDVDIEELMIWNDALPQALCVNQRWSKRPIQTANLILESPYDDGTSAIDYSGNGNHGTVTGAVQIAGPPLAGWTAPLLIG